MKFFVLFIPLVLMSHAAQAQTAAPRLGELRQLLQQKTQVYKAPAVEPAPSATPSIGHDADTRQLSAEERAELRRQLTEFRRPAGKGS